MRRPKHSPTNVNLADCRTEWRDRLGASLPTQCSALRTRPVNGGGDGIWPNAIDSGGPRSVAARRTRSLRTSAIETAELGDRIRPVPPF